MNSQTLSWRRFRRLPRRAGEIVTCLEQVRNWPYVMPAYAGFRKFDSGTLVRSRAGLVLKTPTFTDLVTAWVILVRSEYQIPGGVTTVLDVGANIGAFTVLASALPGVRVVSLEPAPETFKTLIENVGLNNAGDRVTAVSAGIAAAAGRRTFHCRKNSAVAGFWAESSGSEEVTVQTITLQQVLEEHFPSGLDYAKIDCEGAEHEALLACPALILRRIRHIGMEYHPVAKAAPLFVHLKSAGFEITRLRETAPDLGIVELRRID